jgi:hypothetical protein
MPVGSKDQVHSMLKREIFANGPVFRIIQIGKFNGVSAAQGGSQTVFPIFLITRNLYHLRITADIYYSDNRGKPLLPLNSKERFDERQNS